MRFETSIKINASSDKIFALYKDVKNWNKWDPEIKKSSIDGEFKTGAKGFLKPLSGPKSRIILTEVTQDKSFTAKTNLPFCSLYFEHQLILESNYTKVIHKIIFEGLLSSIFGKLLGNKLTKEQSKTMKALKKEAEK